MRIYYKDETTFKSIMVDKTTTVEEALASAAQKFKTESLDLHYLREYRNGQGAFSCPMVPTPYLLGSDSWL